MGKALIVYFSRKGENYWNGSMKNLEKGNTEIVAEMIAELTGGELFEVKRITDYAAEYRKCVEEAKEEFQTAYVLPLYLNIFPENVRAKAAENLVQLVEKNDYKIGTGFPGTPYILFALADSGHADTAFKMLLNTQCPGWLYEVRVGATTV